MYIEEQTFQIVSDHFPPAFVSCITVLSKISGIKNCNGMTPAVQFWSDHLHTKQQEQESMPA